jgi:hypothetical protein
VTSAEAAARLDRFAYAIRKVGPEFCILSSDLGQKNNALPTGGYAAFLLAMRARGFTDRDIDRMSKQNPARLLGLDGDVPRTGEWRWHSGDLGSTKYSPLDQINKDNVSQLHRGAGRLSIRSVAKVPDFPYCTTSARRR